MVSLDYELTRDVLLTVLLGGAALYIGVTAGRKKDKTPAISHLFVYPIKSCAEISVKTATATELGLEGDRIFQVTETKGDALYCTPRDKKYAKLFHIQQSLNTDQTVLTLKAPGAKPLEISLKTEKTNKTTLATPMIGPKVTLDDCGPDVAQWVAKSVGVPDGSISLTKIGKEYQRNVEVNPDQKEELPSSSSATKYPVSLADEAPYLLTSTTSLEDLNVRLKARAKATVDMRRFRPNFVVEGLEPWIEDTWSRIRIGDKAEFFVWQRCGRCTMTTIDRDSLARGPEPLATLSTFRERAGGQRNYGMHLIPVAATCPVEVHVGDKIEVLEYDTARLEEWKKHFGKNDNVSFTELPAPIHRYVRLNLRFDAAETLRLLQAELLECTALKQQRHELSHYPRRVTWLPTEEYYALPVDFPLAQSECYKVGRYYGQDVSSGAAVAVMRQFCKAKQKKLRILDLCCAPGQKLLALADGLASDATVVGVDVSSDRLAVCQKTMRKYYTPKDHDIPLPRVRLYCCDGTTFATNGNDCRKLVWDSIVAQQDSASGRRRLNKSAKKRQSKQLQAVADWDWNSTSINGTSIELFDAVLVDAECSTDGSVKHVEKRRRLEWTEERLSDLVLLQRRLAMSGFRLLKPGGILVYSTCSLERDQNEGVVEWLLHVVGPQATLLPLNFPDAPSSVQPGSIDGTLRLLPSDDKNELTGGGFFLSAVQKKGGLA